MNEDERLEQNIQRSTAQHALKQIHGIVEKENADDAFKGRALGWLFRYGWLVLLVVALLFSRYLGVI
jgi:fatty acid desaturase